MVGISRKFSLVVVVVAAVLFGGTRAEAYEVDTHFYDTYAMAREAGFKHEYARFLALGAQWVDQGVSSSAMGGPVVGKMLRRTWHFPTYLYKTKSTGHGASNFKWIGIATFNHPVAHKLFDEGMRQSNWMKVALSIHVIQDSSGHSGFSDALGHAEFGHNPDRTWMAPKKYKRMTGMVFQALVALRKVVPEEALEPWALKRREAPVTAQDHVELQESFWKKVGPLVSKDYFRDPRYTPSAVNEILRDAKDKGFLIENANFKVEKSLPRESAYLLETAKSAPNPLHTDRKDARTVLKEWVTQRRMAEIKKGILVKGSIFNLTALDAAGYKDVRLALEKVEREERDPAKRVQRYQQIVTPEITKDVIHWTVDELTRGHIPQKFGPYIHVQFESEDGPRTVEKWLKEKDRRAFIKGAYGKDIKFGKEAGEFFSRKDQISAALVKWGHNIRTVARSVTRRGIKAHHQVKGYQSPEVLNQKLKSNAYPEMGELGKRSLYGRSKSKRPKRPKRPATRARVGR